MRVDGMPDVPVSHATLDADDRLVAADPAIMALNDGAGGTLGQPLAVPQLATVARLARRLGILVSRGVKVADQDADLDLWVRVQPEGEGVRMAVSGWRETRARTVAERPAGTVIELGDLAWETDAGLRLTFVSIDAARRLGLDALSLLGQPLTALFTLDAAGDGTLPILEAVARRRPLHDQRARLRGGEARVLLTASIRHDTAGGFAGLNGVARIAEEAPPPPAPAISSSFTEGLDKALRTPLARIIAHADTIHAEAEGPVQRDYVDYASDIANAGRHLLGLVDDLVDLQAVERPDFALAPEPIDLADVARRAAGLLSVKAGNAGVAIARPLPDLRVPAAGDFRRALQIMVNLIGNAVRYSPEGGVASVTATLTGGMAEAVVADQGKGIAAEDQMRIFEKFERVDPTEAGGNGLGLYIARRLARAMGGDLTVESTPGEGARFTLTLPV
ncbi:HAMP domain-containing histidine kinase [Sphingomonas sp. RP10(2022)]|uniref:histidine kinase n=1 Tax=Sphingomonas liriopis TaxID=2949094 RepID=A0A9X2HWK5_9SPHN|nr:HAMP domain-containing sensor histidine kinase [Sphingomonas liriopis]MCP3733350.1 HAMP domain-containing histidine kinase [Sphingomonas liriopis]